MEVRARADGTFTVTLFDEYARKVRNGAPATMTGIAGLAEPRTYVIAQPVPRVRRRQ